MTLFTETTGTANPFNGIDVGNRSTPTFADIDGDGDLDAIVGENNGTLKYYENMGSSTAPVYSEVTGTSNPFNGIVDSRSAPTFADIDGDGNLDAIVGERLGTLKYYENTGSGIAPVYSEVTGTSNPFNGIDVGYASTPTFADIDGDGDLDAIVGELSGTLKYYENTGSGTAPVYSEVTGTSNPLNGIDVGNLSTPTFADIDGDGDLDAMVGERLGTLKYYKNTGSVTAPVYSEVTGTSNPFNGIDVGRYSTPTFADINGDGDLDTIIGEKDGTLRHFLNESSASSPTAVQSGSVVTVSNINTDQTINLTESGGTLSLDNPAVTFSVASLDEVEVRVQSGNATVNATGISTLLLAIGSDGNDQFTGGDGNDVLIGRGGDDNLIGGAGNDRLIGGAGADSYDGGTGNDTVVFDSRVSLNLATGTIIGGDDAGKTIQNVENMIASAANDTIIGDDNRNRLYGNGGNDVILAAGGNDTLSGGAGDDYLDGGAGNDRLLGGTGADSYNGGAGNDTVIFDTAVSLDLGTQTITAGDDAGQNIQNVESIIGSNAADSLTGDSNRNRLIGRGGNDTLNGAGGSDTLVGGDGNDTLNGGDGNDTLNGGDGNDLMMGGAGADSYDGGAGSDQVSFGANDAGVTIDLAAGKIIVGEDAGRSIKNVEKILATNNADQLQGNSSDNVLIGRSGNDVIFGGAGRDRLFGGNNNDMLVGGDGSDFLAGNHGADTFVFNALSESSLADSDRILDFTIGTDVFQGPTAIAATDIDHQLGAVSTLTQSGIEALLTTSNFESNTGAIFTFKSKTYLALNDGTAGFSESTDAVVNITGYKGDLSKLSVVA